MLEKRAFPLRELPYELQRLIVQSAARLQTPSALNLSLACKTTSNWARPIIFSDIIVGFHDSKLLLRALDSCPPTLLATHVNTLCLTFSVGRTKASKILSKCTNITSLACWVDFAGHHDSSSSPAPRSPTLLPSLLAPLSLKRLSIEAEHMKDVLQQPHVVLRWCSSLTHLELIFWRAPSLETLPLWKLDALTHLGLSLGSFRFTDDALLFQTISQSPSLEVVALLLEELDDGVYDPLEDACLVDQRIAVVPYPHMVKDWEASFRGQPDIWVAAERIVEQQKQGMPHGGVATH